MKRDRPILVLDVETTGIDPIFDRIVELGIVSLNPFGGPHFSRRFNPGRKIPAEATAVHGITDADVAGCLPFEQLAGHIADLLLDADLIGYNLRRLDLPIIDEEMRRCGYKLPITGRIIDVYGLWLKKCPRSLEDAVREFCGREHVGAHGALADANATMDVMSGMLARWPELSRTPEEDLARMSNFGDRDYADLAGKLYRDADGDLRYAFGKAKDVKVRDDIGYANWMLNKASFPGNTNDVLEAELDRLDKESGPVTDAEPEDLF